MPDDADDFGAPTADRLNADFLNIEDDASFAFHNLPVAEVCVPPETEHESEEKTGEISVPPFENEREYSNFA